jgi:hypothetical protein
MAKPQRLRLSRSKGFNLQAASRATNGLKAVTVARPSRWGNPFVIGRDGTQAQCVERYSAWLALPEQEPLRREARAMLTSRNLACWCAAGAPCHGDILLDLVSMPAQ